MYRIVSEMSPQRLAGVYSALPAEAREALDVPVAQMLNSRVASVRRRPVETKVRALRAFLGKTRDESLATEILRAYLLGPRKDLVTAFLDGTGVVHEDGQVDGEAKPDGEKVAGVVADLLGRFDREDVLLYLRVAALQWSDEAAVVRARDALMPAPASGA